MCFLDAVGGLIGGEGGWPRVQEGGPGRGPDETLLRVMAVALTSVAGEGTWTSGL